MSYILTIFPGFYVHFKQFSKLQLFVKFPEHILTTSLTLYLVHVFIRPHDLVWPVIIPHHYHEYRFWQEVTQGQVSIIFCVTIYMVLLGVLFKVKLTYLIQGPLVDLGCLVIWKFKKHCPCFGDYLGDENK